MKNERRTQSVSRHAVSGAVAELMPHIMRGIQLDFFIKRGVTQTQFLVLAAVRAYGRCTMGSLARSLHVSMPAVTGVMDRLVRAGLIQRIHDPDDRRQVVVELTPKAQHFFQQFQAVVRHRWEEILLVLQPKELAVFYDIIRKLSDQLRPARP